MTADDYVGVILGTFTFLSLGLDRGHALVWMTRSISTLVYASARTLVHVN
jgi:hypothetical protein